MKIGVVPTSVTMRGSQAMRTITSATRMPQSQRSHGKGRFSAIQAVPGTIRASATVSQPFSSAKVSASASAAIEPVAKIAAADAEPGRGSRLVMSSVANANSAAISSASAAKGSERSKM